MNNNEDFQLKSIGKRIKLARNNLDLTQEQLAEKAGLSPRFLSQLERGVAFGSANTIISICKTLKIDPNFLFGDLVKNSSQALVDMIDMKFLENYLKLDSYNKSAINSFTTELLKLQTNSFKSKKDA